MSALSKPHEKHSNFKTQFLDGRRRIFEWHTSIKQSYFSYDIRSSQFINLHISFNLNSVFNQASSPLHTGTGVSIFVKYRTAGRHQGRPASRCSK